MEGYMDHQQLICRACLRIVENKYQSFGFIEDATGNLKDMIMCCVPEMDIYVSSQPIMCFPCIQLLITVYNFKTRCLNTETIIRSYIQRNNLMDYNHVNLNCVVEELIRLNNLFHNIESRKQADAEMQHLLARNQQPNTGGDQRYGPNNPRDMPLNQFNAAAENFNAAPNVQRVGNPLAAEANPLVTGEHPLVAGANPAAAGENPHAVGGHPPAGEAHPFAAGGHPFAAGGHPLAAGVHPLVAGGNQINALVAGRNPLAVGAHPLAAGGHPHAAGGHPLATGGHPLAVGRYQHATGAQLNPLVVGGNQSNNEILRTPPAEVVAQNELVAQNRLLMQNQLELPVSPLLVMAHPAVTETSLGQNHGEEVAAVPQPQESTVQEMEKIIDERQMTSETKDGECPAVNEDSQMGPAEKRIKLVIKIDKTKISIPFDKNEDSNEKENEEQDPGQVIDGNAMPPPENGFTDIFRPPPENSMTNIFRPPPLENGMANIFRPPPPPENGLTNIFRPPENGLPHVFRPPENSLIPYQPQDTGQELYQCENCTFVTTHLSYHLAHKKICLNELDKYDKKCPHCPHVTNRTYALNKHINTMHTKSVWYSCDVCPYRSTDPSCLRRHKRNVHPEVLRKELICHLCSHPFTTEYHLKKHLLRHDENTTLQCQFCSYSTRDRSNFRKHIFTHNPKSEQCEFCNYKCVSPYQMKLHLKKMHHGVGMEDIDCRSEVSISEVVDDISAAINASTVLVGHQAN